MLLSMKILEEMNQKTKKPSKLIISRSLFRELIGEAAEEMSRGKGMPIHTRYSRTGGDKFYFHDMEVEYTEEPDTWRPGL
jgi:hypothetical protein